MASTSPSPTTLEIFKHLFASVAEEMGVTLGRTAYSPNIKERLDYSCALFIADEKGSAPMLAQAAHIPVHLGAMPASVQAAIAHCSPFVAGDVVILNDPYQGGTHLPDVTLVSPIFLPGDHSPTFFVASRAHHADIGGMSPGSMPLSTEIYQEGLIIPPIKLQNGGQRNEAVWQLILRNVRTPDERRGDLAAQLAAHNIGARRVLEIVSRYGRQATGEHARALLAYAEKLTRACLRNIPPGHYSFEDFLEPADPAAALIPIRVKLTLADDSAIADFSGTSAAVTDNLNAGRAIVESAFGYVVRLIGGSALPMNAGVFAPLTVIIPHASLLDARPPSAVAAGNVETSQRVVDVLMGAFAKAMPRHMPAASQGTMNNITFGGRQPLSGAPFAYYETMGGGAGAGNGADGASGVHVHMSNTRNTPIEALEMMLPIRIERYALRSGSGGQGQFCGGDGLRRDIRFLTAARVSVLSERRRLRPWGINGGEPGMAGANVLIRQGGEQVLPAKFSVDVLPDDVISIQSPGGGGWGKREAR